MVTNLNHLHFGWNIFVIQVLLIPTDGGYERGFGRGQSAVIWQF